MRNRSLGAKLFAGLGLLTLSIAALGGFAVYTVVSLRGITAELGDREARKTMAVGEIQSGVSEVKSAQVGMLLAAMTGDPGRAASLQRAAEEGNARLEGKLRELSELVEGEAGRRKVAAMKDVFAESKRASEAMAQALREQKFDEATRLQGEVFYPLYGRLAGASGELVEMQRGLLREKSGDADARVSWAIWVAGALCLASMALSGMGLFLVRGALKELGKIADEVSGGAREVGGASRQVSSSSQSLAQGASEQAASLEETSASTEEINSMTQKNAENARQAATETEETDRLLRETNGKLDGMIASMREINSSSERVSKIIKVIDEIAFQTNILALNAAVEAARAGEAGMGFAVVADEVRNLAQRCTQAARDTSELIEESIARSKDGRSRLDEVAEAVRQVVDRSSKIRLLVNEVHVGSQEQARGIEQIARAVEQMQQVTQSNAASAEQGASAGQEMSAQADQLGEAVRHLNEVLGKPVEAGETKKPGLAAAVSRAASASRPVAVSSPVALPSEVEERRFARGKPAGGPARRDRSEFPMDDEFRDF